MESPYTLRLGGFCLLVCLPICVIMMQSKEATADANADGSAAYKVEDYTKQVKYVRAERSLVYGDEASLRAKPPLLPDAAYKQFVTSMPIVCVDVLLTRADGSALLVQRHAEPVKGLYWYPGGRLLMGESFADAALRKTKKEIGLVASFCRVLGTWNTIFERSAWGAPSQTINVLVHAVADDASPSPRVCGDKRGKCADGHHGGFKWVSPQLAEGEDVYILEGLAALRGAAGRACGT